MTIRSTGLDVEQVGDLTRVSHGSTATPEVMQAEPQANRVGGQSLALNGEQLAESAVTQYSTHRQSAPGASVMSTMRRDSRGVSVELVPGQPASRTLIQQALREGLVREVGPGIYEDLKPLQAPAAGDPQAAPEPVTDKPAGEDAPFAYIASDHAEEWQELVDPLPQPAYDGAVATAMSAIVSGEADLGRAVQRLAQESGMDPEQARELVETGEAMQRESLTRDLVKSGLIERAEADLFYEFCRTHKRLPEALSCLMGEGKTRVFRSLATEWATRAR